MRPHRPGWAAGPALALAATAVLAAGEIGPGSYCPLPKPGETPSCLEPAKAEYGDFFQAVDTGDVDDARMGRVERELADGADSENAYLALSSLAYGYYRLSQQAARSETDDPEIAARLERWNALLGQAFDVSEPDGEFRDAVRTAALDLQRNAPPVRVRCIDASGETSECDSTDAVVRGIDQTASEVGIRGALERLLERITGSDDS